MSRFDEMGILLLGLAAVGMGVRTIRRREEVAIDEIGKVFATYRGPAALSQGMAVVLAGVGIVTFAVARLLGIGPFLESHLRHRPGILILFISLAGLAWSLSLVFGSVEQRTSTSRLLASAPGRVLGAALSALAVIGLGLGIWEVAAPSGFDHFINSLTAAVFSTRPLTVDT
jgi:hypothetical protein